MIHAEMRAAIRGTKGEATGGSVKTSKTRKSVLLEWEARWEALIGGEEGNLDKEGFNKEVNVDKARSCSP
jgi:hypothetical protein